MKEPQTGQAGTFQVNIVPKIRAAWVPEESLEVFLRGATTVVRDSNGLLSNGLVTQVLFPVDPSDLSQWKLQVDFKQTGSDIFSQIVDLVMENHAAGKSWNGHIYAGMFRKVGGQVFLRPGAAATHDLTDENGPLDYGAIVAMLNEFTGLRFRYQHKDGTMRDIMYPIYMDDLIGHLNGNIFLTTDHSQSFRARALDKKYRIFLRCHPTFLTTAARGVVMYYIRCHHSTSTNAEKFDFDSALNGTIMMSNWSSTYASYSLFQGVFAYASRTGYPYQNEEQFRFIRD